MIAKCRDAGLPHILPRLVGRTSSSSIACEHQTSASVAQTSSSSLMTPLYDHHALQRHLGTFHFKTKVQHGSGPSFLPLPLYFIGHGNNSRTAAPRTQEEEGAPAPDRWHVPRGRRHNDNEGVTGGLFEPESTSWRSIVLARTSNRRCDAEGHEAGQSSEVAARAQSGPSHMNHALTLCTAPADGITIERKGVRPWPNSLKGKGCQVRITNDPLLQYSAKP